MIVILFGMTACQNVDSLVNSIASRNTVECASIGFAGASSKLYQKFEQLKRKASKEELYALLDHDSLAVVAYASYVLIDKAWIKADQLLAKFIDNEEFVSTFCGCLAGSETISSIIYHRYWNSRIDFPNEDDERYVIRDSEELQQMDSLVLFTANPDWLLVVRAFENRIYSAEYSAKIEEWAFDKNNLYALKYVFENLREGNEELLTESLNQFLEGEDVYKVEREEVAQMLAEIK